MFSALPINVRAVSVPYGPPSPRPPLARYLYETQSTSGGQKTPQFLRDTVCTPRIGVLYHARLCTGHGIIHNSTAQHTIGSTRDAYVSDRKRSTNGLTRDLFLLYQMAYGVDQAGQSKTRAGKGTPACKRHSRTLRLMSRAASAAVQQESHHTVFYDCSTSMQASTPIDWNVPQQKFHLRREDTTLPACWCLAGPRRQPCSVQESQARVYVTFCSLIDH